MKKNSVILLAAIVVASFMFTACPYSASIPLSDANVKLDASFLGKWILVDEYAEQPSYFNFSDIDGSKFKDEKNEYNSTNEIYEVAGTYVCHFTDIGKTRFANMNQDGTFYFYKIEMTNATQFKLYEVTDNIDETFSTSAELMSFFSKYKDLSFFYNKDEEVYNKATK